MYACPLEPVTVAYDQLHFVLIDIYFKQIHCMNSILHFFLIAAYARILVVAISGWSHTTIMHTSKTGLLTSATGILAALFKCLRWSIRVLDYLRPAFDIVQYHRFGLNSLIVRNTTFRWSCPLSISCGSLLSLQWHVYSTDSFQVSYHSDLTGTFLVLPYAVIECVKRTGSTIISKS